jgi:predicted amidohydrolase YtcJ
MAHDAHGHDDHGHGAHGPDAHGHDAHGAPGKMDPRDVSTMIAVGVTIAIALIGAPILVPKIKAALGGGGEEHHGGGHEKKDAHDLPPEHGGLPRAFKLERVEVEHASIPTGPADMLLVNVRATTLVTPAQASVIAIKDGKIIAIGGDDIMGTVTGPKTVRRDLRQAAVVPGLRDAHGHIEGLGQQVLERTCDLTGATDIRDVKARLESWLVRHPVPRDGWVVGFGWDQTTWPDKQFPGSTELLDQAVGGRPAILSRIDGHAAWVSKKALELAKIGRETPTPEGGRILRDKDGQPTGVLVDNAVTLVENLQPPETDAQIEEDLLAGATACARAGLVEVHAAGLGARHMAALRRLAEKDKLPIRVYAMHANGPDLEKRLDEGKLEDFHGRLTVRAIKLVADGAMGSRGARLLEPYADEPKSCGLMTLSEQEVERIGRIAVAKGFQVCVHAIGDAANREVLEAFERALGDKAKSDHRWRIEHAQLVNPADRERFARLGVIASMQPRHATSDMRWAEARLGKERLAGAYSWRSMLSSGVRIAFGSDFPVEPEAPLLGLYAAVTRQDEKGEPAGGWLADERVSPFEAIRGFTYDVAFASFAEKKRGALAPGMDADLTVIDARREDLAELLEKAPRQAIAARVVETWVGGVPSFTAPGR